MNESFKNNKVYSFHKAGTQQRIEELKSNKKITGKVLVNTDTQILQTFHKLKLTCFIDSMSSFSFALKIKIYFYL